MGLGGISVWQLVIILIIVVLIFGTKKLKNMGGDIGGAVKNFKSAVKDPGSESLEEGQETDGDKDSQTTAKTAEKDDAKA